MFRERQTAPEGCLTANLEDIEFTDVERVHAHPGRL